MVRMVAGGRDTAVESRKRHFVSSHKICAGEVDFCSCFSVKNVTLLFGKGS